MLFFNQSDTMANETVATPLQRHIGCPGFSCYQEEKDDVVFVSLWLRISGYTALGFITFLGNGLLLLIFLCFRQKMKHVAHYLLVNLYIADAGIGFLIPISMTAYSVNIPWLKDIKTCITFQTISEILLNMTMLTTLFIAFDQLWAIYNPFTHRVRQTCTKVITAIFFAWCFEVALQSSIAMVHFRSILKNDMLQKARVNQILIEENVFSNNFTKPFPAEAEECCIFSYFLVIIHGFELVLPLICLTLCNFLIYNKINSKKSKTLRRSFPDTSVFSQSYSQTVDGMNDIFSRKSSAGGRRISRDSICTYAKLSLDCSALDIEDFQLFTKRLSERNYEVCYRDEKDSTTKLSPSKDANIYSKRPSSDISGNSSSGEYRIMPFSNSQQSRESKFRSEENSIEIKNGRKVNLSAIESQPTCQHHLAVQEVRVRKFSGDLYNTLRPNPLLSSDSIDRLNEIALARLSSLAERIHKENGREKRKKISVSSTVSRKKSPFSKLRMSFHMQKSRSSFLYNRSNSLASQTSEDLSRTIFKRRNRKALIALMLFEMMFLICWCPFVVVKMLRPFIEISDSVYLYCQWICYVHSGLNPFLHIIAHTRLQKYVMRFLGLTADDIYSPKRRYSSCRINRKRSTDL